ncbi:MAG: hypothetical protein CVV23_00660 [Ignavibacteriae bacterium HGW-Ignavibacteriae-2]|jgi:Tfp pilus assembly protein PilF|nr:tetratricopeptide repeat protein [Bacteroidota bacterium]PKL90396.1 MAG: hypothetical protein CVV23_00660 [Ignavibacteriae bacterium HGW-Ignavibacteriae-2]
MDNIKLSKEYLKRAFEFQVEGKLFDAEINFKLSLQYNPTSEAHTFLGWLYSISGKYEEAIEECIFAIQLDHEFGNPYNDIGSYLVQLGKEEESIKWFSKAIKAPRYEPRHLPYFNLGKVYRKKGDWRRSAQMFKSALIMKPDYSPARKEYYKIISLSN